MKSNKIDDVEKHLRLASDDPGFTLSNLQPPSGAKRQRKRVGRGEGSGTGVTAGRGHKGQQSRSGYSRKRGFEGGQMPMHRRLPKRGFHNRFRVEYEVVNLDVLEQRFESGSVVTPDALRAIGLITRFGRVKVLGRGDLSKTLSVKAHRFSATAREKITGSGGQCELVENHVAKQKESA